MLDYSLIWKAVLVIALGTMLLRISGRKSISQMTLPQTVLMVGIGTLLIQPIANKNFWYTIGLGVVLVGTLLVIEYLQLKFDFFEKLLIGQSKVVIENGTLNTENLKKLKLTVDQLEMKLRQKSVMNISDVQWATLEPNGQLGFALKPELQPVTKKELNELTNQLSQLLAQHTQNPNLLPPTDFVESTQNNVQADNLFTEVAKNEHQPPPPKYLQ